MKKKLKQFILKYSIPIEVILVSLNLAGAGITYDAYKKQKIEQINNFGKDIGAKIEQINNFGTLKNPKYLILNNPKAQKIELKINDSVYDILANKDYTPESCNQQFLENVLDNDTTKSSISIKDDCNQDFLNLDSKLKDYKEIDVIKLAKNTFKALTGKEFPESTKIYQENNMKDMIGYHNYTKKKIAYKNVDPYSNIDTLLHEFGHMIVQHNESGDKDESVLEEACAYAFSSAGFNYIINNERGRELKKFAKDSDNLFWLGILSKEDQFYKGKDDKYKHNQGAALFRETFAELKDYNKTFNYLATLNGLDNLDPKIKQRMENSKKVLIDTK